MHRIGALLFVCAGFCLLAAPLVARASSLEGNPDSTGIIAVDCSLFFEDRNVSLATMLFGNRNQCDARPILALVGPKRRVIAPGKKDRLYFFDGLSPGTYELLKLSAYVAIGDIPGEKPSSQYETSRSFEFELVAPARATLSVDVTPGSVTYLGRVDVINARYREEKGFHITQGTDQPELVAHLRRDSLADVTALRALRKAARGRPWEARLNALPDTALHAAARDTFWVLP